MTAPCLEAFAGYTGENAGHAANRAPEYFEIRGYKSPVDSRNSRLQFALKTDLPFFKWLYQDPAKAKRFDICMTGIKLN